MPQLSQTSSSETAFGANRFPAFVPAVTGGPARQDIPVDQNAGEGMESLLKLVASLESCNTALLDRLNHAERELYALKNPAAAPTAEATAGTGQLYGWERKLTRSGWRPPP